MATAQHAETRKEGVVYLTNHMPSKFSFSGSLASRRFVRQFKELGSRRLLASPRGRTVAHSLHTL